MHRLRYFDYSSNHFRMPSMSITGFGKVSIESTSTINVSINLFTTPERVVLSEFETIC